MTLIDVEPIYKKVCELEELARDRVIDCPTNSPVYMRYVAQLNERTTLKHLLFDAPTIETEPVKQFVNELIYRLNNHANRYVGSSCNGTFYPEVELFDVDEVYEIIDRVLDGTPEDIGTRMDGE